MIYEMGIPKRILIEDPQEEQMYIDKYLGITNLYKTIYKYTTRIPNTYKPDYKSAIINKIFLDLDSKNSYKNMIKIHKYLISKDIKHSIKQTSWNRFHIYIYTTQLYSKEELTAYTLWLLKQLDLTYGIGDKYDIDKAVIGDLARLTRIPSTFNVKRGVWCNWLEKDDLVNINKLKQKVLKKYDIEEPILGTKNLIIENQFIKDTIKQYKDNNFNIQSWNGDSSNLKKYYELLPPFIKKILNDYQDWYGNYKARWYFTIFCRDFGYPKNITESLAKKFFSNIINYGSLNGQGTNYDHYCKVKVLDYVYENPGRYIFPSIYTLKQEGYELEERDLEQFSDLYF